MRQRDIERVMAAAWAVEDAEGSEARGVALYKQRKVLESVDPHGVYRPGAPMAGMDCQADFQTLRESPRYIRSADDAGTHE